MDHSKISLSYFIYTVYTSYGYFIKVGIYFGSSLTVILPAIAVIMFNERSFKFKAVRFCKIYSAFDLINDYILGGKN